MGYYAVLRNDSLQLAEGQIWRERRTDRLVKIFDVKVIPIFYFLYEPIVLWGYADESIGLTRFPVRYRAFGFRWCNRFEFVADNILEHEKQIREEQ